MLYLIILDLFWSGAAWIYDWSKLVTIPPYFWPFVAVCPIYPLLLALVMLKLYRKKTPNQFLLAFAVIPSIVFGVLATLYYPVAMIFQGFSWNALGQIFWVWVYGAQGIWLYKNFPIEKPAKMAASVFVVFVLLFQFFSQSYGYFDFTGIAPIYLLSLLAVGFFSIFFLARHRILD